MSKTLDCLPDRIRKCVRNDPPMEALLDAVLRAVPWANPKFDVGIKTAGWWPFKKLVGVHVNLHDDSDMVQRIAMVHDKNGLPVAFSAVAMRDGSRPICVGIAKGPKEVRDNIHKLFVEAPPISTIPFATGTADRHLAQDTLNRGTVLIEPGDFLVRSPSGYSVFCGRLGGWLWLVEWAKDLAHWTGEIKIRDMMERQEEEESEECDESDESANWWLES